MPVPANVDHPVIRRAFPFQDILCEYNRKGDDEYD
jgi:hypothetical protein